jgi:hydrogenase nickel incorporation protein HypA/HybF
MHELDITESIVAGVCERVGAARVLRVILEVGKLSQVVPDSIRFFFDVCTQGTSLEGAALEVLEVPGRARCRVCQAELEVNDWLMLCGCGSAELEVLAGQRLLVKAVEVA